MALDLRINTFLQRFDRFGVRLGLERIEQLLQDLGHPHLQVPVLHVAGTNGKGSVCAYLSAILTAAGYRVGRYTSPHLVDWTERICLQDQPIDQSELLEALHKVETVIDPSQPPTQFELLTAAAWWYFAQQRVDIAVMEVGLGGRLDATNVCDRPLVSVITSLSRDHWQRLGPTLANIAAEKAGILKPGCPAVIGPLPPDAEAVVHATLNQRGCKPIVWVQPAQVVKTVDGRDWASYEGITYPLALAGQFQLTNSALAIATIQLLRQQGWEISKPDIITGMAKTRWPGRIQWLTWHNRQLLIDGAHNSGAAIELRRYVDSLPSTPVSWVMGMLDNKDHQEIFQSLLQAGDSLYLVPIPGHQGAEPEKLASLVKGMNLPLHRCQTYIDLQAGLQAAWRETPATGLIVLCGSLYLIGEFLAVETAANVSN
uniref:tetrahydrofolate synthase n=1 Tax=Cyanothece sp. (strain PCC 7425 / ATCC 29141) TaxID=395961 RepID=B8HYL5_CYAP4